MKSFGAVSERFLQRKLQNHGIQELIPRQVNLKSRHISTITKITAMSPSTLTKEFLRCNDNKKTLLLSTIRLISTTSQDNTYQFKAETKKLLQIVAHSLYSDKEVFIRELISNASDALEKLRFLEATREGLTNSKVDPEIPYKVVLSTDDVAKTFTIEDTGVGMTKDELINNLGTIAKSGSLAFLEDSKMSSGEKANAIIGQFGVGFYSSFVVSNNVEVFTRSYSSEETTGYHWVSDGSGEFTVREVENLPRGTKIICHLKDDCLLFCNSSNVKKVAEKYSAFLNFPLFIKEKEADVEVTTQKALWVDKNASEEEHLKFFRFLNNTSWGEPFYTLSYHTDAPLSIKSLFYIPTDAPSRMFQSGSDVGVSLHSRRILVNKAANSIIPKWLFFIKGVIDCEDMPLNVSREVMQDSQLVKKLSNTIVARILRFLNDESTKNPEKYKTFYEKYNYYLKEGVLDESHKSGQFKDNLLDLLRFETSISEPGSLKSLQEYLDEMKPNQKNIYYFCVNSREMAMSSPYIEPFKRSGISVLLLFDDIDEFLAMNIQTFKEKKLVAIDSQDEEIEGDFEASKQDTEVSLNEYQRKKLSEFIKTSLGSKVQDVKFSERLVDSPAVVTGFLSPALRKVMKATMKGSPDASSSLSNLPATLQLNPNHKVNVAIFKLIEVNAETAKVLVEQLYDNASVAAGIVDDPRVMLNRLNKLLSMSAEYAVENAN